MWEGRHGCIVTSTRGHDLGRFVQRLARLPYEDRPGGCTLNLPVDNRTRTPTVMLRVDGVGGLFVRPHTRRLLDRVPCATGVRTAGGELFRARGRGTALLLVTSTAVVDVTAEPTSTAVESVRALTVTWTPPS